MLQLAPQVRTRLGAPAPPPVRPLMPEEAETTEAAPVTINAHREPPRRHRFIQTGEAYGRAAASASGGRRCDL